MTNDREIRQLWDAAHTYFQEAKILLDKNSEYINYSCKDVEGFYENEIPEEQYKRELNLLLAHLSSAAIRLVTIHELNPNMELLKDYRRMQLSGENKNTLIYKLKNGIYEYLPYLLRDNVAHIEREKGRKGKELLWEARQEVIESLKIVDIFNNMKDIMLKFDFAFSFPMNVGGIEIDFGGTEEIGEAKLEEIPAEKNSLVDKTSDYLGQEKLKNYQRLTSSSYYRRDDPSLEYSDRCAYKSNPQYTNRNISKWWTTEHDKLIEPLIEEWQWHWDIEFQNAIESMEPSEAMAEYLKKYSWGNKVTLYAITRAWALGLMEKIRKPEWKICPLCNQKFIENSLPYFLARRLEMNNLDFCSPCLCDFMLYGKGDWSMTRDQVLQYLRDLTNALQRIPAQSFGEGVNDFKGMDFEERLRIFKILKRRPSKDHLIGLFGSWLKALIAAGILEEDFRRLSMGILCLAKDGHACFSLGEKTIDDFLHLHGISHGKEPKYPNSNFKADFIVKGVLIEYFGLQGNPEYDKKTQEKKKFCDEHGIQLISIFPSDLVSVKKIENKLKPFLS